MAPWRLRELSGFPTTFDRSRTGYLQSIDFGVHELEEADWGVLSSWECSLKGVGKATLFATPIRLQVH